MRVAVIGAGAAGLLTARALLRHGHAPVVLEADTAVGGTWRCRPWAEPTPDGILVDPGAMYPSLRTNLPRDLMAVDDRPFVDQGGGDPRRFPGHAEVLRYLEGLARDHDLLPRIRFGVRVTGVSARDADDAPWRPEPTAPEPTAWHVRWIEGVDRSTHAERFDAVAVCNGHYHVPRIPSLPGRARFGARVLHSQRHRSPEPFAGQTVALLGAKASGIDLCHELATAARRVILCGRDLADADGLGPRGNVSHRPAIAALEPRTLVLTDGRRVPEIDALVLCTGYRYAFEFLDEGQAAPITVDDNRVFPLWQHLLWAHARTLAFVGLPLQIVPFPLMDAQATLWAAALAERVPLPDAAARMIWAREHDARLAARGVPLRHRHLLGPDQFDYIATLAAFARAPAPPAWRATLYRLVGEARRRDPIGYRDQPLPTAAELHAAASPP